MPKRIDNVTRDYLVNAELPVATKSYTVISHEFVINTIKEKLADKGFNIIGEKYRATDEAKVATGVFQLQYNEDPDLGLMFAFANSYDKSLKFRCAIGGYVKTNNASVIASDSSSWTRKHTGSADTETVDTIETLIEDAFDYFDDLKNSKERMKNITISREDFSKLVGVLFVDLGVINTEQISLIKQELDKPSYQYSTDEDSLWTRYNHILVALKKSHPKYWMEQQKLVHLHMMTQLDMIEFDQKLAQGSPGKPDDVIVDPNQTNLIDMIDEVEQEKATVKMEDIALTPDELSEQLYGVNNNEEEITMTAHVKTVGFDNTTIDDYTETFIETDEEYNARVAEIEGEREEEVEIERVSEKPMTTVGAFKLPVAPALHEEMREMDQAIKDDSANIPQLNASTREEEVEIERVAERPRTIQDAFDIPQMPAPDTATEDEDISDDLVVEEEMVETTVEDIQDGEFFISEMELGMSPEVGETVTIGDDYYFVDRKTELNGVPGYTLVGFVEEEQDMTDVKQEEIIKQIAEDEAAVAEVCDKPSMQEEPVEESEPEELDEFEITNAPEKRGINVLNSLPSNGTAEDVEQEEEVVDASEQFDKLIEEKEIDRVRQAISQQLMDLYGSLQQFEYTESNGQFNVTLETGESIVIPADLLQAPF